MKNFRCRWIINEEKKTVVCLSSFAGQVVRGVAHCAPYDEWDIEVGKEWAMARCKAKLALKKLRWAESCGEQARELANYHLNAAEHFMQEEEKALEEVKETTLALSELEAKYQ